MAVSSPAMAADRPHAQDTARLLVLLALALAALSYVNTLTFSFVYDDLPQLVSNPRVHGWQRAPKLFAEQVWTQSMLQGTGNYYRPVFELWLLIQYNLFGLHPWAYHLASVLIHVTVVGLVYLVFKRLTQDRLTAGMGAILFAVHPTHIETVAWISGSTDLLCAFFLLCSFLVYLRARDTDIPTLRQIVWQAAALTLYALAMMSKETAVVLPALLITYEWWLGDKNSIRTQVLRCAPFVALTGVYLLVRHWVLLGFMHPEPYTLSSILLTLPRVLWFYARHLIWPVNLSVFYDSWFVDKPGLWDFYLPLVGILVFTGAVVWVSTKSRAAAFGAGWTLAMLSPALIAIYVFIPEELVHDRYLYLPSIGFTLLVAVALRQLKSKGELFGGPLSQVASVLILAGTMAAGTATQNIYWNNNLILFAHGMNVAPRNVLAINHLANEFFRRGKPSSSFALYHQALELRPNLWQTHFALGITHYELGHYEDAVHAFDHAIPLGPENAEQFYFLGLSELNLGDNARAEQAFEHGLQRNPNRPGMNSALATALLRQGKTEAAKNALRAEVNLTHDRAAADQLRKLETQ